MTNQLLAATRKGLFVLDDSDGGWSIHRRAFLGDNVNLVACDERDGAWYASLDHGHFGTKLHRSEDRGETWDEITCPAYPEMPEGYEEPVNPFSGVATPWALKKIWSLQPGPASRAGELWCGTIPGGLFRSSDRGDSWEMIRSLWDMPERQRWMGGGEDHAGIHSICLDPRDDDHLAVGVSVGGVWSTRDAGQTWQVSGKGMVADYMPPEQSEDPIAQDPHYLVRCPADPDTLWTQHHNGVFVTRDNAASWERIEGIDPSTFGFAVAVHPEDPDTTWLVPAVKDEHRIPVDGKLVVTRTRDGGKSWQKLSDGLPQSDAYDLVYRHALDIHPDGQRLAFGSTTGSLWTSENQGDAWSHVSAHLPPVYCVRFAPALDK